MALGQSSGGPDRQLSIFLSLTSPLARNAKSNKTKPKSRGHSSCGEKLEVPQRQGQASSQEGSPPEKKLGVSRGNARRVGERGAQNRGELATGGPNQVKPKETTTEVRWRKNLGFPEGTRDSSWQEERPKPKRVERPKPKRVVKRSAQTTKPKEQRQCRGGEKTWGFQTERKASRPEGRPKPRRRGAPKTEASGQEERPTNKTERTATVSRWGKNLGFPDGTQGESARGAPKTEAKRSAQNRSEWSRGAPNQQNRKNSDSGAVGKKLGVSRRNARRVGQGGAQNRGEEERPKPKRVVKRSAQPTKPKEQRQWRGGEKTWGFQTERKESRPEGRPKPRRVGKRSAQPTKSKEQRQRRGGGKTWGFHRERKASRPKGRPKPKRVAKRSARQKNRREWPRGAPNQQNRKNSDSGAVGKKLGVSRRNARRVGQRGAQNRGEKARGAPNQQNRKHSDRGAVGKKIGVSRGNTRRAGQRGAQNRDESARGAPNKQNRKNRDRGAVGKKLGVSRGNTRRVGQRGAQNRGESPRGAPNQQNRKNNDRGAVGKKLGVSRGNARRVGQRGAQNRGESPRGAPNLQNRKSQRKRCGGEKTWGFQRERKASRRNGRPKPRRVGKRSNQPTKPKEQATEVRWGENLGFPEGTQGESARGAIKKEECRQEERRTNKTQRDGDRGAVGRKLGVSRGNARRVGQRGAQHRGESPRGATSQQNPKSRRQRCGGEKTWGFQRERKASRPEGRPTPRRVAKRSAQPTKPNEPATEVRWGKNLGFPEGTQGESARGAPNTEASRQEERPTNKTQRAGDRGVVERKLGVS
jgi:hypothetical protein